jgi:hypothetical protein
MLAIIPERRLVVQIYDGTCQKLATTACSNDDGTSGEEESTV